MTIAWLALFALVPLSAGDYRTVIEANHGHILVVAFWATWCEPCREELPRLRELARKSGHRVRLVTISADEPEQIDSAERFLKGLGIRGHHYQIAGQAQLIGEVDTEWTGALPALFVYNGRGKLITKYLGEVDWPALERLLRLAEIDRQQR